MSLCRPDEILGPYAGGLDTTAEDRRASDKDAPVTKDKPMRDERWQ
jgi:hypothetical protein